MRARIEEEAARDASDQWYAAVEVAGQGLIAVLLGAGILSIQIRRSNEDALWEGVLVCQDTSSTERVARVGLAGEAALMVSGLAMARPIEIWGEHRALAALLRDWRDYWEGFGEEAMLKGMTSGDNTDLAVQDEEIAALLSLWRCQVYRLLRSGSNSEALEALAELLRVQYTLSGDVAEQDIRLNAERNSESETLKDALEAGKTTSDQSTIEDAPRDGEYLCLDAIPRLQ